MNQYCNLEYIDNGFTKAVQLPIIILFDDNNDSSEYVEQLSLSRLVKTLGEVLAVGKVELSNKVDEFFAERKKLMKEKFPHAKVKFTFLSALEYSTFVSGDYNDDAMEQFLDVLKEDFQYIFEGLTLDIEI